MFRSVIIAMMVYSYGHPHFDGSRPQALNKPIQNFYAEVNSTMHETGKALGMVNDFRTGQHLAKLGDKLRLASM